MNENTNEIMNKLISEMIKNYKPRDSQRIPVILSEIQKVWEQYPDLRLGQLIMNCCANGQVLFNIEDDMLLERIIKEYK